MFFLMSVLVAFSFGCGETEWIQVRFLERFRICSSPNSEENCRRELSLTTIGGAIFAAATKDSFFEIVKEAADNDEFEQLKWELLTGSLRPVDSATTETDSMVANSSISNVGVSSREKGAEALRLLSERIHKAETMDDLFKEYQSLLQIQPMIWNGKYSKSALNSLREIFISSPIPPLEKGILADSGTFELLPEEVCSAIRQEFSKVDPKSMGSLQKNMPKYSCQKNQLQFNLPNGKIRNLSLATEPVFLENLVGTDLLIAAESLACCRRSKQGTSVGMIAPNPNECKIVYGIRGSSAGPPSSGAALKTRQPSVR